MLKALTSKKEVLIAVDKKPKALKNYNIKKDSRFTGGLPEKVTVAVGAKVMLVRNIDVADGLVNGAQGTVCAHQKRLQGCCEGYPHPFQQHRCWKIVKGD